MDLQNIMLSEVNQTEKNIYCMISLICGTLKIIQMNLYAKQKQTHRYRKLTCGYQRGEGMGEGQIRGLGLTDTKYYV